MVKASRHLDNTVIEFSACYISFLQDWQNCSHDILYEASMMHEPNQCSHHQFSVSTSLRPHRMVNNSDDKFARWNIGCGSSYGHWCLRPSILWQIGTSSTSTQMEDIEFDSLSYLRKFKLMSLIVLPMS